MEPVSQNKKQKNKALLILLLVFVAFLFAISIIRMPEPKLHHEEERPASN